MLEYEDIHMKHRLWTDEDRKLAKKINKFVVGIYIFIYIFEEHIRFGFLISWLGCYVLYYVKGADTVEVIECGKKTPRSQMIKKSPATGNSPTFQSF